METTLQLTNGKIIETNIEIMEHDPQVLLATLEAQKASVVEGRDQYLSSVNAQIDVLETKILTIKNLLA